jgi:Asp-tRNA(Asn)/Glu-tRNA(Gln) amidotransferase C subunit
MSDFSQELKYLQNLSCIALSPEEEKKFWSQLKDIIWFLGQLPETEIQTCLPVGKDSKLRIQNSEKLSLRTIAGVKENIDCKKILNNVKHPIVNNSIVIKSVLS